MLLLGGFLGGLQLADFIYDKTGTFNFSTQLVLDMSTALFFTLGSLSVYKNDKGFAVPVLVSRFSDGAYYVNFLLTRLSLMRSGSVLYCLSCEF